MTTQVNLISAIESAIDANGLESVLQLFADTVADMSALSANMGFGLNSEIPNDWNRAAEMIRGIAESLPDSTR